MQYNTVMTNWMTATRYKFSTVVSPNSNATIREFFPAGTVKITVIARTDRNVVVYCDEPLELFERLGEIRDRSGRVTVPYDYRINSVVPTTNPMGFSDGYSYRVSMVPNASAPEGVPTT